MIYKCKNCGKVYYEHTDYCECGNNSFVLIKSTRNTNSVNDVDFKSINTDTEEIHKNSQKTLFAASIFYFIFSIIFFVILIYKAMKMPSTNINNSQKVSTTEIQKESIPLVDEYWDNTPVINTNSIKEKDAKKLEKQKVTLDIEKLKNNNTINSIQLEQKAQSSKENNKTAKNQVNKQKISDSGQNKKEIKNPKPEKVNIEEQYKQKQETNADKSKQTVSKENEKITNEEIKKEAAANAEELSKYKARLRQHLFSYFPILNVQGIGTAKVGFSIADDGKLLNRRFIIQSENKTLNDALYHMLMQTPYYNPPPKGYKGEELILKMEYDNGHYRFSYE